MVSEKLDSEEETREEELEELRKKVTSLKTVCIYNFLADYSNLSSLLRII